jgi:hypothetical protein
MTIVSIETSASPGRFDPIMEIVLTAQLDQERGMRMKLKCPDCGAPVPAANINISTMTALCDACDSVFKFDLDAARGARKVKPPQQVTVYDDAPLHFAFKWDFRTEPLIGLAGLSAALFGAIIVLMVGFAGLAALLAALPVYVFLTIGVNSTHYRLSEDQLEVYTTPLLFPYYGRQSIALDDLTRVTTERMMPGPSLTSTEGFYNVYAHTVDGQRLMIARLVNGQHAQYIAQEIPTVIDAPHTAHRALFDPADDADLDADIPAGDLIDHEIRRQQR